MLPSATRTALLLVCSRDSCSRQKALAASSRLAHTGASASPPACSSAARQRLPRAASLRACASQSRQSCICARVWRQTLLRSLSMPGHSAGAAGRTHRHQALQDQVDTARVHGPCQALLVQVLSQHGLAQAHQLPVHAPVQHVRRRRGQLDRDARRLQACTQLPCPGSAEGLTPALCPQHRAAPLAWHSAPTDPPGEAHAGTRCRDCTVRGVGGGTACSQAVGRERAWRDHEPWTGAGHERLWLEVAWQGAPTLRGEGQVRLLQTWQARLCTHRLAKGVRQPV